MIKYYSITPKLYFKTLRAVKNNTYLKTQTKLAESNNMELVVGISDSIVQKAVNSIRYDVLKNGYFYKLQTIANENGLPLSLLIIIAKKELGGGF